MGSRHPQLRLLIGGSSPALNPTQFALLQPSLPVILPSLTHSPRLRFHESLFQEMCILLGNIRSVFQEFYANIRELPRTIPRPVVAVLQLSLNLITELANLVANLTSLALRLFDYMVRLGFDYVNELIHSLNKLPDIIICDFDKRLGRDANSLSDRIHQPEIHGRRRGLRLFDMDHGAGGWMDSRLWCLGQLGTGSRIKCGLLGSLEFRRNRVALTTCQCFRRAHKAREQRRRMCGRER